MRGLRPRIIFLAAGGVRGSEMDDETQVLNIAGVYIKLLSGLKTISIGIRGLTARADASTVPTAPLHLMRGAGGLGRRRLRGRTLAGQLIPKPSVWLCRLP